MENKHGFLKIHNNPTHVHPCLKTFILNFKNGLLSNVK